MHRILQKALTHGSGRRDQNVKIQRNLLTQSFRSLRGLPQDKSTEELRKQISSALSGHETNQHSANYLTERGGGRPLQMTGTMKCKT